MEWKSSLNDTIFDEFKCAYETLYLALGIKDGRIPDNIGIQVFQRIASGFYFEFEEESLSGAEEIVRCVGSTVASAVYSQNEEDRNRSFFNKKKTNRNKIERTLGSLRIGHEAMYEYVKLVGLEKVKGCNGTNLDGLFVSASLCQSVESALDSRKEFVSLQMDGPFAGLVGLGFVKRYAQKFVELPNFNMDQIEILGTGGDLDLGIID